MKESSDFNAGKIDSSAIGEVELLLAEKRTALSVLRTGIAVLALPMSAISFLIATSKFYDVFHTLHLLIPLSVLCLGLIIFGAYLIVESELKMMKYDNHIQQIKSKHSKLGELIE